ncbi:MAG: hypothetical protein ACPGUD_14695 [Parashewanella sp.]
MSLTSLLCDIDDFCLEFEAEWHKQLIEAPTKPLTHSRLALSEIMTILIYFHQSGYRDFKHY